MAPDETVIKTQELDALKQQVAQLQQQVATISQCEAWKAQVGSLTQQLAETRAGDPLYQKLEAQIEDLQNRLTQAQSREATLRQKLNELIQIEKNAGGLPAPRR